jgi:hypothetical protein
LRRPRLEAPAADHPLVSGGWWRLRLEAGRGVGGRCIQALPETRMEESTELPVPESRRCRFYVIFQIFQSSNFGQTVKCDFKGSYLPRIGSNLNRMLALVCLILWFFSDFSEKFKF